MKKYYHVNEVISSQKYTLPSYIYIKGIFNPGDDYRKDTNGHYINKLIDSTESEYIIKLLVPEHLRANIQPNTEYILGGYLNYCENKHDCPNNFYVYNIYNEETKNQLNKYYGLNPTSNNYFMESIILTSYVIENRPCKIGLIVGHNSWVLKDIELLISSYSDIYCLSIINTNMNNVDNLINTLLKADNGDLDIIIIARGGVDDINRVFNNPNLALCIQNLNTYTITSLGHSEVNSTCGYISNMDYLTPSALGSSLSHFALYIKNCYPLRN